MSKDKIVIFMFPSAKSKELLGEEIQWLIDVSNNSWWQMKRAQRAVYNPKFEKMGWFRHPRWWYVDRLKDTPTWLEVTTTSEKDLNPTHPLRENVTYIVPSLIDTVLTVLTSVNYLKHLWVHSHISTNQSINWVMIKVLKWFMLTTIFIQIVEYLISCRLSKIAT